MAKATRPTFAVPNEILPSFERYVAAKQVAELAQARMESEEGLVKSKMLDSFADSLAKLKCKPTNPRLTISKDGKPDIEGLFQVQSKFFPQVPPGDAPNEVKMKEAFVAAGVSPESADKVMTEVACFDKTTTRPMSELNNGAPIEQELATRLKKVLEENFNEDERKLLMQRKDGVEVKDGFFERLGIYVKNKEEVLGVLRVLKPVHFVSHMKLGLSETPQGRLTRLYEYAKSFIVG